MTPTQTWPEFYKGRMGNGYFEYAQKRYEPFIKTLEQFIPCNGTVVESGCGIGTITRKLISLKPKARYIFYDNDSTMLRMAHANVTSTAPRGFGHLPITDLTWLKEDIRTSLCKPGADLIFGHGVLEHFSDQDIEQIIGLQRMLSKYVIHYVPTIKYPEPSFGDERLLSPLHWKGAFEPDHCIQFNNNYDLILIWKGKCS